MTSRVLSNATVVERRNGDGYEGKVEYFPEVRSIVMFDDEELAPVVLTVNEKEAPEAFAQLGEDEVLIANWAERRGVAASLVEQGLVQLTGAEAKVGPFGLQALVAEVR